MIKLAVVVVLYKRDYADSVAIKTILDSLDELAGMGYCLTVFVWNNSPGFSRVLAHPSVVWNEGANSTLPCIYNHIADLAFGAGASALMISDDDTDYSRYDFKGNFEIIDKLMGGSASVGCFIPRIRSAGKLVSPGGRFLFKGRLFESVTPGLVSSKNLLAINSGVIVTRGCYEAMGTLYDERLNFYGTDTDFFVRYQNFYPHVYIFDSLIEHSLSEHAVESIERALFRWRDHIFATKITYSNRPLFFRVMLYSYLYYLRFKLVLRYRSLRFMF